MRVEGGKGGGEALSFEQCLAGKSEQAYSELATPIFEALASRSPERDVFLLIFRFLRPHPPIFLGSCSINRTAMPDLAAPSGAKGLLCTLKGGMKIGTAGLCVPKSLPL